MVVRHGREGDEAKALMLRAALVVLGFFALGVTLAAGQTRQYNVLSLYPSSAVTVTLPDGTLVFSEGSYYDQVYSTISDLCVEELGCDWQAAKVVYTEGLKEGTDEYLGEATITTLLRTLVSGGDFDHVIVAGPQFGEPVRTLAPEFPSKRFTVVDFAYSPPMQNVEGIIFRDDQIGYLAGVVACEVANAEAGDSADVAVVAGVKDSTTMKRVNGFVSGCSSVCPGCSVDYQYDVTVTTARDQIARSPIVLFGSGTPVGHAALSTAANQGIYVIGVDGDEYVSTFANGQAAGADKILTSAVKNVNFAVRRGLLDGLSNSFRGRNILLGLGDDALSLADCHDACNVFTPSLQQQTVQVLDQLSSGQTDTGVNRISGEVMNPPVPPASPTPAAAEPYRVLSIFPGVPPFPTGSYYDQVYQTLRSQCIPSLDCSLKFKTYSSDSEISSVLSEAAGSGEFNHIIVAGPQFGAPIQEMAKDFPKVRFSGIDYVFCHTCAPLTNVEGIIFRDDQIGFAAGVVACEVAGEGSQVAVVAGPESSAEKRRVNGFSTGCRSVCSSCTIDAVYDSTPTTVQAQLSRDPKVVFGSGTKVGHDAIKTAAAQGIYVVGVDGDEYLSTFDKGGLHITGADKLLTSTLKRLDTATATALRDGLTNSFRERNLLLGLDSDAVGLAPCHDACDAYTAELQAQTDDILEQLANGQIDTGVNRATGELMRPLSPATPSTQAAPSMYRVLAVFPDDPPFQQGSYYDQVYRTLSRMCIPSLRCVFTSLKYPSESTISSTITDAAGSGDFDHIIMAGAQFGPAILSVAPQYPTLRFSVIDYAFSPPLANVEGIVFRDDQIGYVAGVVACEVAGSGSRVAVIAGKRDSATKKRSNGFMTGCLSVCSDCNIDAVFDSTQASVATQLSAKPAVVFGSGTKVGHDALKMAAAQGLYVIGVDGDEYYSTFESGNVPGSDRLLTSAVKKLDQATRTSLTDGLSDTFRGRNVLLDLEDDALGLAPCHDACDAYSSELQAQTTEILEKLGNGQIDTGVNRITGELIKPLSPATPSTPAAPSIYRVLGVFPDDPPFQQGSYYDQVYRTLSRMCIPSLRCAFTSLKYPSESTISSTITDAADSGDYDHIITAGEQFGSAMKSVAPQFPTIRFSVIDYAFSPPLPNVEGIIFRDDQIGYVAGVVACEVAGSGSRVAVIAGKRDSATKKRSNGFMTGCLSVCSDCNIDAVFDSTQASVATQLSAKPAVVFGSGTKVGHDALETAAAQGLYVIGVDGDEYYSTFESGNVPGSDRLLTSAVKKLDQATATALRDGLSDTFRGRNVLLDLEDDALGLAPCHDACDAYTAELQAQTTEILEKLGNGQIDTGVNRITGDLMVELNMPPANPSSSSNNDDDNNDDGNNGLSALSIVIISLVGAVALAFAVFALAMFIREKKGRPMFVSLDEELDLDAKNTEMSPSSMPTATGAGGRLELSPP